MDRKTIRRFGLAAACAAFIVPPAFAQGMMGGPGMMPHMPMIAVQHSLPRQAPAAISRYSCMSCHAVAHGVVGPAFEWVAWKYQKQPDALARVSSFIEHGGTSTWGGMMPDLNVPDATARDIAQWILKLKPVQPPQTQGEH
ncbi:c-type cytochrome [Acidithiobacillus ferrooxidans]|uniref:c-type cytochrome n=1 Tax=Acidithiobacillus ferrooxidans TaxID=920 RepID=UPI001D02701D|nr:cytochrome C [Acidithiobacillus ferrooxidans]